MADVVKMLNSGLEIITNRIKGAGTEPNYVSWGTGTVEAAVSDTSLTNECTESRTSGTSSRQTTSTTNDTYRIVGTITCVGASKAITEVGLFDALTAGNMFTRATFSPINVNSGDSIQFTVNTVFDQA
jgi:hypothetical protein